MASFMSYFGARKDPKQAARDAIVNLRQQLQMIDKKEEYLQKKIEEETKKARANAVSNKTVATAALKRRKMNEIELNRLGDSRFQLETQVNTLESANMNAETMAAMKKASDALKVIHGNITLDKVDTTINALNEQRELANEIAEAIANPVNDLGIDEDELKQELEDLQQDELNERLNQADHVPVHQPPSAKKEDAVRTPVEDDEEEQLKALQAELAM